MASRRLPAVLGVAIALGGATLPAGVDATRGVWYYGSGGQSCTTVCSDHRGCVGGTWPVLSQAEMEAISGGTCGYYASNSDTVSPHTYDGRCFYNPETGTKSTCSASPSSGQRRLCYCNPCAADADCGGAQYCAESGHCKSCADVTPASTCDAHSGDCCGAAFLGRCPLNPRGCKCSDPAADNYNSQAVAAAGPGANALCRYSSSALLSHFSLPARGSGGECYVDQSGTGRRWPPAPVAAITPGKSCTVPSGANDYCADEEFCVGPFVTVGGRHTGHCSAGNNTYMLPVWSGVRAVVIQGKATAQTGPFDRTQLTSRVDAVGPGSTLVLRHLKMVGLAAVVQPTHCSSCVYGGAVYVEGGSLIVQYSGFHSNTAQVNGGALAIRLGGGQVQVLGCTFELNTAGAVRERCL
eukprot:COSAG06_NODE_7082_length_2640_cov_57.892168_3_plen_410_part_00